MPLSRIRRRLLLATLVVVGLIGGAWWSIATKVDRRFVGSWRFDTGTVVTLEGGGSFFKGSTGLQGRWWTQNNRIVFHKPAATWVEEISERAFYEYARLRGLSPAGWYHTLGIVEVADKRIVLSESDGTVLVLTRIDD